VVSYTIPCRRTRCSSGTLLTRPLAVSGQPDACLSCRASRLDERYLTGAERDTLDPILDACVAVYREDLNEDGQVDFKGKAKAFLRAYGFLSSILPYTNAGREKLSIFLTFLVPKLPAPVEDDLSRGILEAIDMDSYRVEKRAAVAVQFSDKESFRKWMTEMVFGLTYERAGARGCRRDDAPHSAIRTVSPASPEHAAPRRRTRPRAARAARGRAAVAAALYLPRVSAWDRGVQRLTKEVA
jgi:hypothetical protein